MVLRKENEFYWRRNSEEREMKERKGIQQKDGMHAGEKEHANNFQGLSLENFQATRRRHMPK